MTGEANDEFEAKFLKQNSPYTGFLHLSDTVYFQTYSAVETVFCGEVEQTIYRSRQNASSQFALDGIYLQHRILSTMPIGKGFPFPPQIFLSF